MFEKEFERFAREELLKNFSSNGLPNMHASIEVQSHGGITSMIKIEGDKISVEAALLDITEAVANAKGVPMIEFLEGQINIVRMREALKGKDADAFDNALQTIINNHFKGNK